MCSVSSSSSTLLVLLLAPLSLAAQSSHLDLLERAAPAVAQEPVASLTWGGWSSAWAAPAGAGQGTGVLLGVERNGFASLTHVFLGIRLRAGPIWQLTFAQSNVEDLFDPLLLERYPGLGDLDVAATTIGLDAAAQVASGVWVSLGGRYERDELLSDAESFWVVRGSVALALPAGLNAGITAERGVRGGAAGTGLGRVLAGVGRVFRLNRVGLELGLGWRMDDLWDVGVARHALAGGMRVGLADLMYLSGAIGVERDPFGTGGWLSFSSFGLGLAVGQIAADVRRGGQADAQAAPTAVSLVYGERN